MHDRGELRAEGIEHGLIDGPGRVDRNDEITEVLFSGSGQVQPARHITPVWLRPRIIDRLRLFDEPAKGFAPILNRFASSLNRPVRSARKLAGSIGNPRSLLRRY